MTKLSALIKLVLLSNKKKPDTNSNNNETYSPE